MTLFKWLSFSLRSLTVAVKALHLDLFISSDPSNCFTVVALHLLGDSDHVVYSVSIDFYSNSRRDAPFHGAAMLIGFSLWSFDRCCMGCYL